jgi:membrane protease YdiL (CAAX protease family)
MEENKALNSLPEERAVRAAEPRVRLVLLVQFGFCLAFSVLGTALFMLIGSMAGWGSEVLSGSISADAGPEERWKMRLLLGISHLFTFVFAGWATVWLFYRHYNPEDGRRAWAGWREYLGLERFPAARELGLSMLLMLASIPLVLYLYQVNKALPMPDVFRVMEQQTNEAIKGLLQMTHPLELVANLVLIALLPAVGEELVFRGVVQRQLMRRIAPPWLALILTAAIFSFIHLQFEGFLPRLLLGLVLGWLYWRTGNLWVPVIAHFFNNALQVVAQYLFHHKVSTVDLEEDVQVPVLAALASLFIALALMRTIRPQRSGGKLPGDRLSP